jgi:hypothetical protein
MKLNTPFRGMPFIWNISDKVGVLNDCANLRDDIELFQRLVLFRNKYPKKIQRAAGIGELTIANGVMDTQTAFEVYYWTPGDQSIEDAQTLSPARNGQSSFGGGHVWKIIALNFGAFSRSKQDWENLPNECSATLKIALTTKTSP